MSNTKLLFAVLAVALATLTVRARDSEDRDTEHVRFYELKKGKLLVNFTNFGARIVSLNFPDKFGNVADIVLGYDSVDAYQEDKYSFGAIVGRVAKDKLNSNDDNGETEGPSNVIWKVLKHEKSGKIPFITFQYDGHGDDDDEEEFPGNLIITATYLLRAKNKLQLTIYAETKNEAASPLNLVQNTYWNLGGHNSSGNILHDHLRVLASHYRKLDSRSFPTGGTLPVNNTPYDFRRYHPIQSRFRKLKNGYHVEYVLDHRAEGNARSIGVELAAVLRDKRSGRVMKVWSDQGVVRFGTGDEVRNVKGKAGVLYQRNSGLVLSASGEADSGDFEDGDCDFGSGIVKKGKAYNQTTVFQFLVKKRLS